MARKHRRRRALSGSPAHHMNTADKLVDSVLSYLEESERLTKAGRCLDSIASLRNAHELIGQVVAHVSESERPKVGLELHAAYDHQKVMAESAFAKKCIVKRARK